MTRRARVPIRCVSRRGSRLSLVRHDASARDLSVEGASVADVTEEERHLIGTSDAAVILGITPRSVQRKANTGQIPIVGTLGVRGEYVFDEAVIEEHAKQEAT